MREVTICEVERVAGGGVPNACQAKEFASEAFAQALGGAAIGFLGGGAPGAGVGFLGGIVSGNIYQAAKCGYSLLNG